MFAPKGILSLSPLQAPIEVKLHTGQAAGLSNGVKRAIGRTKGCAHLTSLVIAMGESAVQGYWAAYGAQKERAGLREQTIKKFINTCHLWKEDGPIVKGLRQTFESRDPSE